MLLEKLKSYRGFTHQEQAVVYYILEHPEDVIEMDAQSLAKVSFTSPSTVVRMCKKIGTSGYPDFRIRFTKELSETKKQNQVSVSIDKQISLEEIIRTMPEIYQLTIDKTNHILDKNALTRITNYMKTVTKVDFYASGSNYACTQLMCSKLNSIGLQASCFNTIDTEYIRRIDPKTNLSFVISHTGGNQTMVDVAYTLRRNNIRTIALTGMSNKALELVTNERLYIASLNQFGAVNNISYLLSLNYLLDILYVNVALSKQG